MLGNRATTQQDTLVRTSQHQPTRHTTSALTTRAQNTLDTTPLLHRCRSALPRALLIGHSERVSAAKRRVAAVFRGPPDTPVSEGRLHSRVAPILNALSDLGVSAEAVAYDEAISDALFGRLVEFDGVLVWVDPLDGDRDRSVLDPLLRAVASSGTWVSAHPDTILQMGTKEVLYQTRMLGWGADTRMYSTFEEFRERFAQSIVSGSPRVVKQTRGNGGIGVWKVALVDADAGVVRVQHAAPRDDVTEDLAVDAFMERCASYFAGSGKLIDQPFAERLAEGMIRAYLVKDEVVGFARQAPASSEAGDAPLPENVLGLPAAKTMFAASEPLFADLKSSLESRWVPALMGLLAVKYEALPFLWDADFLYGPKTVAGADSYMLCEINVSSVSPFPDQVVDKLAHAVLTRLQSAPP